MMNRDMKRFLASLVTGEMSVIQAAWINKDAMLNSLHVQEEAQQSLLHYGSKRLLDAVWEPGLSRWRLMTSSEPKLDSN